MSFFDRAITGQLVSRITNDTEAVKELYTKALFEVLVGAHGALRRRGGHAVARLAADADRAAAGAGDRRHRVGLPEAVGGRRHPPARAAQRHQRADGGRHRRHGRAAGGRRRAALRAALRPHQPARTTGHASSALRANAWLLRPALDFINVLLIVAIVAAVGTHQMQGVEVGLLYAFIAYVARVVEPLIQITLQFSTLQQSVVAASRVDTLLHEAEAPRATHARAHRTGPRRARARHLRLRPGAARCCTTCRWRSRPAASSASSATPAAASRRCSRCCCASTCRRRAASRSTACRSREIGDAQFRADVGLVPQEPFLLARARARTSTWAAGLSEEAHRRRRARRARARLHRAAAARLRHAAGRGRRAPVGRAEAAPGRRPRARRPSAHPVPRRGDVAHRQRDGARGAGRGRGARARARR